MGGKSVFEEIIHAHL